MATDNFTDSNDVGLETHDANWTSISATYKVTNLEIISNTVRHEGAWQSSGAYYAASSVDTSQIIFKAGTNGTALRQVAVRCATNQRGYALNLGVISGGNYTTAHINKNGSWFATPASGQTWSVTADHTVKITVSGTSTVIIDTWVDGSALTQKSDSSSPIGAGSPGFFTDELGTIAEGIFDDWTDGVAQQYQETLASIAVSASSITDIQTFINIVSDQITSVSSLTDAQAYIKNLLSLLESYSVVSAIQTYVDTLASVAQSVSSLADLQAYVITLADLGTSSSSITDIKTYIEIVQTIIVSSSSITESFGLIENLLSTIQSSDSVATVQAYFSSLLSTLVSLSSISDKQIYIHNLLTLIQSQVSIADQQAYIHGVQDLITSSSSITDVLTGPNAETLFDTILSQAGVYDYYQKPGMIETTPPFYLDPGPEFQMGDKVPTFIIGDKVPTFIIEKRKWT
jgi:hypothetical protein